MQKYKIWERSLEEHIVGRLCLEKYLKKEKRALRPVWLIFILFTSLPFHNCQSHSTIDMTYKDPLIAILVLSCKHQIKGICKECDLFTVTFAALITHIDDGNTFNFFIPTSFTSKTSLNRMLSFCALPKLARQSAFSRPLAGSFYQLGNKLYLAEWLF